MVLRSGAQASVVACASSSSAAATRASQVPTLAPRPLAGTAWSAAYSREGRTQMRLQVARRDEQQPQRQVRRGLEAVDGGRRRLPPACVHGKKVVFVTWCLTKRDCAPPQARRLRRLHTRGLRAPHLPWTPQDRSPSPARAPVPVPAAAAEADNDSSLFFTEPLLRGLVLGVGAGVLCELVHVALKVRMSAPGWRANLEPCMTLSCCCPAYSSRTQHTLHAHVYVGSPPAQVGDIASDNAGWHLPSIAAMYEHLRPLFVVDHVAAL